MRKGKVILQYFRAGLSKHTGTKKMETETPE